MFAFDSQNPMHSYSTEDDTSQLEYASALDSCFGKVEIAAPAKAPAQTAVPTGSEAAITAGPSTSSGAPAPPFDVPSGGASSSANLQSGHCDVSGSSATMNNHATHATDADTAAAGAAPVEHRFSAPSEAAQNLASESTGACRAAGTPAGAPGGQVQAGTDASSLSSNPTGVVVGRTGGVLLEYEVVTPGSLTNQSTEDLMLRLMCQTIVRGQQHQQLVDSLQMRALALHMQACISF